MDFLRYLSSRLDLWYRPRPLHDALQDSLLFNKMPPEMILYISTFLSPDCAASFSLSCCSIYFILGTQHIKHISLEAPKYPPKPPKVARTAYCLTDSLRRRRENALLEANISPRTNRQSFLEMLERDLPDHILCFHCKKFHSMLKTFRQEEYDKPMKFRCGDLNGLGRFPYAPFSSVLFQMATKRYRQGLDYSKWLTLLSYPTWNHHVKEDLYGNELIQQGISSVRIVGGSFLYREHTIFTFPRNPPIPLSHVYHPICPHYTFSKVHDFGFQDRSSPIREQWNYSDDYKKWKGMVQCKSCFTEFRIDFKDYESLGTALFLTVWKDFGPGVDQSDLRWQSHTSRWRFAQLLPESEQASRVSIATAYEGKGYIQHEDFDFAGVQVPWLERTRDQIPWLEKRKEDWTAMFKT